MAEIREVIATGEGKAEALVGSKSSVAEMVIRGITGEGIMELDKAMEGEMLAHSTKQAAEDITEERRRLSLDTVNRRQRLPNLNPTRLHFPLPSLAASRPLERLAPLLRRARSISRRPSFLQHSSPLARSTCLPSSSSISTILFSAASEAQLEGPSTPSFALISPPSFSTFAERPRMVREDGRRLSTRQQRLTTSSRFWKPSDWCLSTALTSTRRRARASRGTLARENRSIWCGPARK